MKYILWSQVISSSKPCPLKCGWNAQQMKHVHHPIDQSVFLSQDANCNTHPILKLPFFRSAPRCEQAFYEWLRFAFVPKTHCLYNVTACYRYPHNTWDVIKIRLVHINFSFVSVQKYKLTACGRTARQMKLKICVKKLLVAIILLVLDVIFVASCATSKASRAFCNEWK